MTDANAGAAFRLGQDMLTPERLETWAKDPEAKLVLRPEARTRMEQSWMSLKHLLAQGATIYGVNTGFGGNARQPEGEDPVGSGPQGGAPPDQAHDLHLQRRLARYLDAGSGPALDPAVVRGILMARAHVLAQGHSAVPPQLVEALSDLFHRGRAPDLPSWGSLGASGDLVTLAPLARHLEQTLELAGEPFGQLPERTALAIMNGLSGVTAQVAIDLALAIRLFHWGVASSAAAAWTLGVRDQAWAAALHAPPVRHHPGQVRIAAFLRELVAGSPSIPIPADLAVQDPYSLRCIPQALGPGLEQLELSHRWIAQELNGVSDNPIWLEHNNLQEGTSFLSSGHFFGGYVVQAADTVSGVLARLGDLLERQTFLLVDGTRGLPENLTAARRGRHGMKGVHQAMSALAMRLQRGALPSAPFARSAEGHNQDIVSNAMNAATVLTDQVQALAALVAGHSAMAAQACEFRDGWQDASGLRAWHDTIRRTVPPLGDDDVPLREPLARLAAELERVPVPEGWGSLL